MREAVHEACSQRENIEKKKHSTTKTIYIYRERERERRLLVRLITFVELEIQRGGVRNPYVIEYCFNQLDIELKYLCMHTNINPILNAICYA